AALAGHIVQAAGQTRSPLDLVSLARSLRSIGRYLPPDGKQSEALTELLFRAWEEAPEEILTEQIGEAIEAVAALLSPTAAGRAADRILAALRKANPWDRKTLAGGHETLVKRLPDGHARPRPAAARLAYIPRQAPGPAA